MHGQGECMSEEYMVEEQTTEELVACQQLISLLVEELAVHGCPPAAEKLVG